MSYICPHCQKGLKSKRNLNAHIVNFHPEKVNTDAELETETAPDAETLEVKTPDDNAEETKYECGNCQAPVNRSMSKCPSCGEELRWGDI